MIKKYTVTIGIPAHNEEANIAPMLHALLAQKKDMFILKGIIVLCDGCTDYTEPLARRVSDVYPEVKVFNDKLRKGKAQRLNELFRMNTSDILICIDADLALDSSTVLEELIKPFADEQVGLVAGYSHPIFPENITQKIITSWENLWFEIRNRIDQGHNIHNIHGALFAARKELLKSISFPQQIIATAPYLFFFAKKEGYLFRFVHEAGVGFAVPTSFKDYFLQTSRYGNEKKMQEEVFGTDIHQQYAVATKTKLSGLFASLLKRPLSTPFALILYFHLRKKRNKTDALQGNGLWTPISSTKKAIA